MKVLLVSGHYYPHVFGGTEKVVQKLAESLVERGHEAVVATLSPNCDPEVKEVNGVKVHYLPLRNVYFPGPPAPRGAAIKVLWHTLDTYNPMMASALGRVLDEEKPDVVNTHNIGGFSAASWHAVSSREIPLVNTAHGINLLCPWYMSQEGQICTSHCMTCQCYSWPRSRFSRKVDVFTGVSRYIVQTYSRYGVFENAEKMVIYNACESARAVPIREFGNHQTFYFGFLGRLHSSKGAHTLIQSFLQIPTGRAELLIAGTGAPQYEQDLKAMVKGHGGVHWLGFVHPEDLLRRTHVLVVPSLIHDSAPLVVLESMAHGVPVIGARRGGIPELMGDGTGWIFDPEQPEALMQQMQCATESRDELAGMGIRAIERAREFSLENMANGYLKAYSHAIERRAKGAGQS